MGLTSRSTIYTIFNQNTNIYLTDFRHAAINPFSIGLQNYTQEMLNECVNIRNKRFKKRKKKEYYNSKRLCYLCGYNIRHGSKDKFVCR